MPGSGLSAAWLSGTVDVSGGYLAFHRTGGGKPAMLLSHGLTDNGLCWTRLAAALASDFDVVMLDARGHGESCGLSPDALHDPARDIAEAIGGLRLENPIVIGHSVGARAVADFASAEPGKASKVILEDPPFLPVLPPAVVDIRREKFRRQVEAFGRLSHADIVETGKASSPLWHADDFPAWATAKRQVDPEAYPVFRTAWQDPIRRIAVPILLIHGDADRGSLVTPQQAREAEAINPGLAAVHVRGAGHNVRRENFAGVLAAVRAFVGLPSCDIGRPRSIKTSPD